MTIPSHPAAIIFVNDDLTDGTRGVFVHQLLISEYITGEEFDARVSADPNYANIIHINNLRLMVIRSLRNPPNVELADLVLFLKAGLVSVLKNNYGPPGTVLPLDKLYLSELILKKNI